MLAVLEIAWTVMLVLILVSLASLIVRFRRSHGEERQQLKWIAYVAGVMSVLLFNELFLLEWLGAGETTFGIAGEHLANLSAATFPIAAAIAILKYRLYDLDLVINRTLVYGALTALLAVTYFAMVVLLQNAIPGADDSDLTIAGSTLAVAALFRPLRSRVQGFIDRRFYRRKFDAQRTLESFSSRLREDVDLDHLTRDFLGVVHDTMQPAHASLWIRTMESGS
jgi:O-antigen/teichoic acid export membrane protein